MKKVFLYILSIGVIFLTACDDDDISVFDKTADERAAEAIANLKADLVAPANGWRVKYKPVDEGGSYYVLMDFDENNKVTLKTDLGADDGKYQEQTISYRIDNSLGLELILENYCFFSFLFEQDNANFGAEYEFNFVDKTSANELMFSSKTDVGNPTILLFQEAAPTDENLLGQTVAINLDLLVQDLDRFSSSFKLTYLNEDLVYYISINNFTRNINFNIAARKSNTAISQALNVTAGYYLQGNSLVLETPVSTAVSGSSKTIESIRFDTFGESQINLCPQPLGIHTYAGVTASNDNVLLETTMYDLAGASFTDSDFYSCVLENIFQNGQRVPTSSILQNLPGASTMQLYYNFALGNGETLTGIGFRLENSDGSVTFALREFTPVLDQNNIIFNFQPTITLFGSQQPDADVNNINIYLDALTQGNTTFVFKYSEDIYEFYNPCSGWTFAFF